MKYAGDDVQKAGYWLAAKILDEELGKDRYRGCKGSAVAKAVMEALKAAATTPPIEDTQEKK